MQRARDYTGPINTYHGWQELGRQVRKGDQEGKDEFDDERMVVACRNSA